MLYARPLLSKKVGGEEKCLEIINVTEHDQMFIFSGEEEGGEENCFILLPGGSHHCQTERKGGGERVCMCVFVCVCVCVCHHCQT